MVVVVNAALHNDTKYTKNSCSPDPPQVKKGVLSLFSYHGGCRPCCTLQCKAYFIFCTVKKTNSSH